MGITGLLPFLEKSSKRGHINQFAGGTAAIDTYCWLHKGVFSCAEKIAMGQSTDAYVVYCMKFIDMLLSYKIKPILVFDGRHLPAKAQTEEKRREARQMNRRKAVELMQTGRNAEARSLLIRSIDVTHEMALELIKRCQKLNIDCIVAPYEADAQLAYLNINGIADVVITEDSDLTLFGCKKIFFKMDVNGNGLLVAQDKLHLAMDVSAEHFSLDDFRNMCILSGCDYLSSLPGIGLGKARKFIKINTDCDIHRALTRLGSYLNMKSLVVTKEYRDAFILASITFKHQLVFCPLKRKQVRLTPPTAEVTEEQLYYAGVEIDPDIALQVAYGNYDPFSLKALHNFDPDNLENQNQKSNTWGRNTQCLRHVSIWSKEYKIQENNLQEPIQQKKLSLWPNTAFKETTVHTKDTKKALTKQVDNLVDESLNQKEILDMYESKDTNETENNSDHLASSEGKTSPVLIRRVNPFTRQSPSNKTSPSLLTKNGGRIKKRNLLRFGRTVVNEETVTQSKFFAKLITETCKVSIDDNNVCSDTNSSQKENMEVDNATETSNICLQVLTVNGNVEENDNSMDLDDGSGSLSVLNDVKDNAECPNTNPVCHLKKSQSHLSINESPTNESDIVKSEDVNSLLTLSKQDTDSDFLVRQGDIDALNNSVFKWSDTKVTTHTNSKLKLNKNRTSLNSRTLRSSKINMQSSTERSQKMNAVQKQQSSLSMFGFEKRKMV